MFTCGTFTKLLVGTNETINIVIHFSNPKDLSVSLYFTSDWLCHCFSVRLCFVSVLHGTLGVEKTLKML